jgi:hypothetical protein
MKTRTSKSLLVAAIAALAHASSHAAFTGFDDFDDNIRDAGKWGTPDITQGGASLAENAMRLEYSATGAAPEEFSFRPWIANTGSYTTDWALQLDVSVPTLSLAVGQAYFFGLAVANAADQLDRYTVALELDNFSGTPSRHFTSIFQVNGGSPDEASSSTTSTSAAIQIRYDAASSTLFADFDADGATGGYSFTNFDSRDVSGWGMTGASQFVTAAGGASEGNLLLTGVNGVSGDNFVATPEPSTFALLVGGGLVCLGRRRRAAEWTRMPGA